jgi:hypothetical protein
MEQVLTSTDPSLGKARDFDVRADGTWVGVFDRPDGMHVVHSNGPSFPLKGVYRIPVIRFLDDELLISLDRGGSSDELGARVTTSSGVQQCVFDPGYGIEDVVPLRDQIAVTYFDEGVFSNTSPACHGLAFYDFGGRLVGGYRDLFGSAAVRIFDCYCACRINPDRLAFSPYEDFSLIQLEPQSRLHDVVALPDALHGARALSIRGDQVFLFGPRPWSDVIFSWRRGAEPTAIGRHTGRLRGLEDGRFISVSERGFTILTCGGPD